MMLFSHMPSAQSKVRLLFNIAHPGMLCRVFLGSPPGLMLAYKAPELTIGPIMDPYPISPGYSFKHCKLATSFLFHRNLLATNHTIFIVYACFAAL